MQRIQGRDTSGRNTIIVSKSNAPDLRDPEFGDTGNKVKTSSSSVIGGATMELKDSDHLPTFGGAPQEDT